MRHHKENDTALRFPFWSSPEGPAVVPLRVQVFYQEELIGGESVPLIQAEGALILGEDFQLERGGPMPTSVLFSRLQQHSP